MEFRDGREISLGLEASRSRENARHNAVPRDRDQNDSTTPTTTRECQMEFRIGERKREDTLVSRNKRDRVI